MEIFSINFSVFSVATRVTNGRAKLVRFGLDEFFSQFFTADIFGTDEYDRPDDVVGIRPAARGRMKTIAAVVVIQIQLWLQQTDFLVRQHNLLVFLNSVG